MNLLTYINSKGITVITVIHEEEIVELANRKIHLRDGERISNTKKKI